MFKFVPINSIGLWKERRRGGGVYSF